MSYLSNYSDKLTQEAVRYSEQHRDESKNREMLVKVMPIPENKLQIQTNFKDVFVFLDLKLLEI